MINWHYIAYLVRNLNPEGCNQYKACGGAHAARRAMTESGGSEKSAAAYKASKAAYAATAAGDHEKAAFAHKDAADVHREAAKEQFKQGNSKASAWHERALQDHHSAEVAHLRAAHGRMATDRTPRSVFFG